MKRSVFALAALLVLMNVAAAKTWATPGCSQLLMTSDQWVGFRYATYDGTDTLCRVESWPVSSPVAKMSCDNGMTPEFVILDDNRVRFNLLDMEEVTQDNDVCHKER